jgi:F420-non-reducing hydrogenase iron-sulfur subunit
MKDRAVKTNIFFCSNHLEAEAFAELSREHEGDEVSVISLPCSGKVDVPYLIKAFESGADGVVIVCCKKNECRHFEGNLRAGKRAEAVESLLEEIGMDAGRMSVVECGEGDAGKVLGEIRRLVGKMRQLPQSPGRSGAAGE